MILLNYTEPAQITKLLTFQIKLTTLTTRPIMPPLFRRVPGFQGSPGAAGRFLVLPGPTTTAAAPADATATRHGACAHVSPSICTGSAALT
jgi:hypothetical protein